MFPSAEMEDSLGVVFPSAEMEDSLGVVFPSPEMEGSLTTPQDFASPAVFQRTQERISVHRSSSVRSSMPHCIIIQSQIMHVHVYLV